MSRDFVGTGYEGPAGCEVYVEEPDGRRYALRNAVSGPDGGLRWDGDGPASSELARALLWEATGAEPEWSTYRRFRSEVVATWPMHSGECWRISDDQIMRWMAQALRAPAGAENAVRTEAALEQMRDRELRLKSFAERFGKRPTR